MKRLILALLITSSVLAKTTTYSTIGSGKDYSTVAAWLAAKGGDLVGDDREEYGQFDVSTHAENITFTDDTTDAEHKLILTVTSTQRHTGTSGSGFYLTPSNSANPIITLEDSFVVIDGIELRGGSESQLVILSDNVHDIVIQECLFIDSGSNGIKIEATSGTTTGIAIYNCIFIRADEGGVFCNTSSTTTKVYNCSVLNCNTEESITKGGIVARYGSVDARNCLSFDNGYDDFRDYGGSGSFVATSACNIASDNTAPGAGALDSKTSTDYYVSTSSGSENLHLKNDADNYAINTGFNLSEIFDTDIDDTTSRGEFWDRGADETHHTEKFQYRYVKPGAGSGLWSGFSPLYNTIATAMTAANSYDKILVAKGTYTENVVMKDNTSLFGGFDGDDSTFDSRGDWEDWYTSTTIDGSLDTSCVIMGTNCLLDGFKCYRGAADRGGAVRIYGDTYCTVRRIYARECTATHLGVAVVQDDATGGENLIEFVVAELCTAICGAIEISELTESNSTVRYCTVVNNDAYGLELPYHEGDTPATTHEWHSNISIGNRSQASNGNVWAWAKDSSFTSYSYAGDSAWVAGVEGWTAPHSTMIFEMSGNGRTGVGEAGFVNEAAGDFRLRRGSPCIGSGKNGADMGAFPIKKKSIIVKIK